MCDFLGSGLVVMESEIGEARGWSCFDEENTGICVKKSQMTFRQFFEDSSKSAKMGPGVATENN